MSKVFVGTWVDKKNQGDVIDLLIMKWLNKKHIKNGRE